MGVPCAAMASSSCTREANEVSSDPSRQSTVKQEVLGFKVPKNGGLTYPHDDQSKLLGRQQLTVKCWRWLQEVPTQA